ncbi:MAG: transposase family protein [Sulfuritalea sp.]|jgi:hypothetical protein|nr:transposase family protein [Sulfuritalea sp.]
MDENAIAGLIERFGDLPDSRVEGRTDHDLLDVVVLALCTSPAAPKKPIFNLCSS